MKIYAKPYMKPSRGFSRGATPARAVRSRGTATVEFVMAIPLLAMVMAGTFFFGWAMRNHQRMCVADRYAAWRSVYVAAPSAGALNAECFDGRGEGTSLTITAGPDGTLDAFVAVAGEQSPLAGELAEELVAEELVPWGAEACVESQFSTSVAFWRRLARGAMETRHVREGPDWVRGEVYVGAAIRELYLDDLDRALYGQAATTSIGQSLRRLYEQGW